MLAQPCPMCYEALKPSLGYDILTISRELTPPWLWHSCQRQILDRQKKPNNTWICLQDINKRSPSVDEDITLWNQRPPLLGRIAQTRNGWLRSLHCGLNDSRNNKEVFIEKKVSLSIDKQLPIKPFDPGDWRTNQCNVIYSSENTAGRLGPPDASRQPSQSILSIAPTIEWFTLSQRPLSSGSNRPRSSDWRTRQSCCFATLFCSNRRTVDV